MSVDASTAHAWTLWSTPATLTLCIGQPANTEDQPHFEHFPVWHSNLCNVGGGLIFPVGIPVLLSYSGNANSFTGPRGHIDNDSDAKGVALHFLTASRSHPHVHRPRRCQTSLDLWNRASICSNKKRFVSAHLYVRGLPMQSQIMERINLALSLSGFFRFLFSSATRPQCGSGSRTLG